MSTGNKCPGSARQRTTGADLETRMDRNFQSQIYATGSDLQTRHVHRRCGVTGSHARLIAALCFGEGGK